MGLTAKKIELFRRIISDPNNDLIPRVKDAGRVIDGNIIMHNGIKIKDKSYYNDFCQIFKINRGVHEPQEELVFGLALKDMPETATMIELGAYWGFYSLWFSKEVKNPRLYLIEPLMGNMKSGKENFEINRATGDFTYGIIGPYVDGYCKQKIGGIPEIQIDTFLGDKGIDFVDILHADIQAAEYSMLMGAKDSIKKGKIKYIFISTHNNALHNMCSGFLSDNGYEIIASADVKAQTFSGDGVLVARLKGMSGVGFIDVGSRSETELLSKEAVYNRLKEI